jgi:hypothetical protein
MMGGRQGKGCHSPKLPQNRRDRVGHHLARRAGASGGAPFRLLTQPFPQGQNADLGITRNSLETLARPNGFEPLTPRFVVWDLPFPLGSAAFLNSLFSKVFDSACFINVFLRGRSEKPYESI